MEKILLSMSRREQEDIDEMMAVTGNDLEDLYAALPNPNVDRLLRPQKPTLPTALRSKT
jgi:hypothetical protein